MHLQCRYLASLTALMTCFWLAACAAPAPAPRPGPITALDKGEFVNTATDEHLHIGLRGRYEITRVRPGPSAGKNPPVRDIRTGSWNLLSAQWQVVILDGIDAVRLRYRPDAKVPYTYEPVTLVAYSALASEERPNYENLQGQWYVLRSTLAPTADERPLAALLEPSARGTR